MPNTNRQRIPVKKIRYAVVGLGHIAQVAVLPAFAHAKENSELSALISGEAKKRSKLAKKYDVDAYGYEDYDALLATGDVDAVYICLPNHMHAEYTIAAARHGVHVLCEKPMAVTASECAAMIRECRQRAVKLMIAYRLHFDEATLMAVRTAHSGRLGEVRFFYSAFAMQVKKNNIRVDPEKGGGPLHDIGIYCINTARTIFRAEPVDVVATTFSGSDERFNAITEAVSAILRFPNDRSAAFTASFGATDTSIYEVVGTKGRLRVEPAYEYAEGLRHVLTAHGKQSKRRFRKHDQFAAELVYFSNCILHDEEPEPSGQEGLNDVRIIEAILESARAATAIQLDLKPEKMPRADQGIDRPPVSEREEILVESPSRE